MQEFVHLHVHSAYSLRESTLRVEDIVDTAKKNDMKAVALTDTCALYAAIPFYQKALAAGVKPILGTQLDVHVDDAESISGAPQKPSQIPFDTVVLLAKNLDGYRALCRLITTARWNRNQPHVTMSELSRQTTDLICLVGGGESRLLNGFAANAKWAAPLLERYLDMVPPGNLYIDLQDHERAVERKAMPRLVEAGETLHIPTVVTGDVHYLDKVDATLQRAYAGLEFMNATDRWETDLYHFASREEMSGRFQAFPNALQNTLDIARACNVELPLGKTRMPLYPTKNGQRADEVLREAATAGTKQRYGHYGDEVSERLDYELNTICDMGFADYFLVVADFIRYAHQSGISTGPGRGSAAGSIVAYALRITDVDPLANRLLFERFLNPARVSLPDIDTDFEYERRGEVIRYVVEKYGTSRVAQIGTFGTLAARAAVRDAGRVLGCDPKLVDKVAKLIPGVPGTTLLRAQSEVKPLADLLANDAQAQQLYDTAKRLEGLPHHTSVHAAGVVISPDDIANWIPLERGADGTGVTQYGMADVESLGLVKMDFLGLRTLTLVDETVESIRRRTGVSIDWRTVADDDAQTYEMLTKAQTSGVFQLESAGMRRVLRQLRPSTLDDIVAVISLMRPGPMENIPAFCDAKHGRTPIHYPHPDLEPILKDTYGVIVYQEQIMQIASSMAGFSLGEADLLRRAVSKKKREVLDEERDRFVDGCVAKGYAVDTANALYDLIVRFADYGFNRSHAAAYAVLAFRTAYLRAHYLSDFLAALMTMTMGANDKMTVYSQDATRHGIKLLPPSVTSSERGFSVDSDGSIRTGLLAVRNVGVGAVNAIIDAREASLFTSLRDFLAKMNARIVNRKALQSLLEEGAFDEFFPPSVTPSAKEQMFEQANRLAEEDKQFAGLGLLLDDGEASDSGSQRLDAQAASNKDEVLYIRYASKQNGSESLKSIQGILAQSTGQVQVALHDTSTRKTRLLGAKWRVSVSPELMTMLEDVVGIGNVKVSYRKKDS